MRLWYRPRMRIRPLSKSDAIVAENLRKARERLGLTIAEVARQIQVPRTTFANYEAGRAALPVGVGLRFCRQFVISEKWLAQGRTPQDLGASDDPQSSPGELLPEIRAIIEFRMCASLLANPIAFSIPQGLSFAVAFERFLRPEYERLTKPNAYLPRVELTSLPEPDLARNLLNSLTDLWLVMIDDASLSLKQVESWKDQRIFVERFIEIGDVLYRFMTGAVIDPTEIPEWLRVILNNKGYLFLPGLNPESKPTVDTRRSNDHLVPVDPWQELVAKLRLLLKEKRGAQAQLAARLGVTRQAVNRWLTGASAPSAAIVLHIAEWVRANERDQKGKA
ncbi:MAG: transcriptional regulator [Verrucomicrobiales bacterium]|nr:transcriptional regulator [Verrucomicrobiales bacterium]